MILEQSGWEGHTVGGLGSGNFNHKGQPPRRTTAEECLSIDASEWTREGILKAGVRQAGFWHWVYPGGREYSVGYEVNTTGGGDAWVRLSYIPLLTGERMDYRVVLLATRPHLGGVRWWFTCPVPGPHGPCGRRVGKLHIPPDDVYFGCRRCHQLTYTSSQQSRYDDPLFRRLARYMGWDFADVKRTMSGYGKPGWRLTW
jgi:hypothetical protein